jgi:hypothetical protein
LLSLLVLLLLLSLLLRREERMEEGGRARPNLRLPPSFAFAISAVVRAILRHRLLQRAIFPQAQCAQECQFRSIWLDGLDAELRSPLLFLGAIFLTLSKKGQNRDK